MNIFRRDAIEKNPQLIFSFTGNIGKSEKKAVKDNWLGNVNVVISDKKIPVDVAPADGVIDYYTADVVSAQDYYPGGMMLPGRNFNAPDYKFGYQGQIKTDEVYGSGNLYSFEFREHDPRLIRFWSVDPLSASYPGWSSYAFAQNRFIDGIDLEGLEWQPVNEQGENVAPDADNTASYNWVGYDKFAYQNKDGSISSSPQSENATKVGIGAPEGTVATGYAYGGDNSARKYTSNQYTQSGTISLATLQQDDINTIGGLDANIQTGAKRLLLRSELDLNTSLRITEGFRSNATQNEYYARSRTQEQLNAVGLNNVTARPDLPWATNATGGNSPHNYGLAFDVTERGRVPDAVPIRTWNALNQTGTLVGLYWGGNFGDRPHFEVPNWRQLVP